MSVRKQRLVAEICHPAKPFCPWAKRPAAGGPEPDVKIRYAVHMPGSRPAPLSDGITYAGFDVRALPSRGLSHDAPNPLLRPGKNGVVIYEDGKEITLSLGAGTIAEFYLSSVATNPYLRSWVMPALVHEARRILEIEGKLVFFNGYAETSGGVTVDFKTGAVVLRKGSPHIANSHGETADLLGKFFTPLGLEGHTAFLIQRGFSGATELEPGIHVSVFVRTS